MGEADRWRSSTEKQRASGPGDGMAIGSGEYRGVTHRCQRCTGMLMTLPDALEGVATGVAGEMGEAAGGRKTR